MGELISQNSEKFSNNYMRLRELGDRMMRNKNMVSIRNVYNFYKFSSPLFLEQNLKMHQLSRLSLRL